MLPKFFSHLVCLSWFTRFSSNFEEFKRTYQRHLLRHLMLSRDVWWHALEEWTSLRDFDVLLKNIIFQIQISWVTQTQQRQKSQVLKLTLKSWDWAISRLKHVLRLGNSQERFHMWVKGLWEMTSLLLSHVWVSWEHLWEQTHSLRAGILKSWECWGVGVFLGRNPNTPQVTQFAPLASLPNPPLGESTPQAILKMP